MKNEVEKTFGPGKVAELLGVNANTMSRWIGNGDVQVIKGPSGGKRIPMSELQRLAAYLGVELPEVK